MAYQCPTIEYIAGFFDADGCVCIGRFRPKDSRPPIHRLMLSFTNNCHEVLQSIRRRLGIPRSYLLRQSADDRRKPTYHLDYRDGQAVTVLEILLPHLRVKKSRAVLGLAFQRSKLRRNGRIRTKHDLKLESEFYSRMAGLGNARIRGN